MAKRILRCIFVLVTVLFIWNGIYMAKEKYIIRRDMAFVASFAEEMELFIRENVIEIELIFKRIDYYDIAVVYNGYYKQISKLKVRSGNLPEKDVEELRIEIETVLNKIPMYSEVVLYKDTLEMYPAGPDEQGLSRVNTGYSYLVISRANDTGHDFRAVETIKQFQLEKKWNIDIAFLDPTLRKWAREVVEKNGKGLLG